MPTELLLDFDFKRGAGQKFLERAWIFRHLGANPIRALRVRETKKGFHFYVSLAGKTIPDMGVVALQAILGSDFKRETYNLERLLTSEQEGKIKNWNVLFCVKRKAGGKVVGREKKTKLEKSLKRRLAKKGLFHGY